MRRFLGVLCVLFVLCGCGQKEAVSEEETVTEGNEAAKEEKVLSIEDCFVVEPSLEFVGLAELEAFSRLQTRSTDGYPTAFKSQKSSGEIACGSVEGFESGYSYGADVVLFKNGDGWCLYDYEGNELLVIDNDGVVDYDPIAGVFYVDNIKEYVTGDKDYSRRVKAISEDFRSLIDYDIPDGLCGNPIYLCWYEGNICNGNYVMFTDKPVKADIGLNSLPDAVLPYVNSDNKTCGSAIITDQKVVTLEGGYLESFVNNMVVLKDDNSYNSESAKYGIYNQSSKMMVTGYEFEDIGFYEEGYIPVKKDDKWGYLDENGYVVIDFVFGDASNIYKGKAWVSYNGGYGVLDINKALELSGKKEEAIGTLEVVTKVLKVRSDTDTTADNRIGNVHEGDVLSYYETRTDDSYTWYRIGKLGWIADDGEWINTGE